MLKKSSSQELPHQIGPYLAWSFPRTRIFNFVHVWPHPRGLHFLHS